MRVGKTHDVGRLLELLADAAIDTPEWLAATARLTPFAAILRYVEVELDVLVDRLVAVVERKSLENLVTGLSDGSLLFQLQRLAEAPAAAVVVEGRYRALLRLPHAPASFLADVLARLQLRYPEVQIVFSDSRKYAEEWTYRYLAAARADGGGSLEATSDDRRTSRVPTHRNVMDSRRSPDRAL